MLGEALPLFAQCQGQRRRSCVQQGGVAHCLLLHERLQASYYPTYHLVEGRRKIARIA